MWSVKCNEDRWEMSERETKVEMTGHREERFKGMGDEGRLGSGQEEMGKNVQDPPPRLGRMRGMGRKSHFFMLVFTEEPFSYLIVKW